MPVTLLQTNACSPLATNALAGNIWDNFSSQSYKDLPSVGTITVHDPFTGEPRPYKMPAGGRGYTRPPSLISLWSTAPFLLNNTRRPVRAGPVGRRPDARRSRPRSSRCCGRKSATQDPVLGDKVPGVIDRTDGAQLITHTGRLSCPTCCARRAVRCTTCCRSCSTRTAISRSARSREGVPVNLLVQSAAAAGSERSDRAARARRAAARLLIRLKHDLAGAAGERDRRASCARNSPICAEPMLRAEQVSGLRGQSRPLLRHRRSRRGTRRSATTTSAR